MGTKPEGGRGKAEVRGAFSLFPLFLFLASATAAAQGFPSKPIRLISTYAPGGNTDAAARLLAPRLAEHLGQTVVVDNRAGAGGVVGTEIVAHAVPDGYTLLFCTSAGMAIQPELQPNLPYKVDRDFAPVSLVLVNPQMLVASPALPAKTLGEFLKLAKAQPGKLNYASVGIGSPGHLAMELIKIMAGVDLVHVPYKGSAPAVVDLLSGNVAVLFSSVPAMLPHIRTGRLRALAVGSATRTTAAPDIPTVAEAGVPGFEYTVWYGLAAPAGTPRSVIAKLNDAVAKSLNEPKLDHLMRAQGSEPRPTSAEEMAKFMKSERTRWARVVKATGLAGKVNP